MCKNCKSSELGIQRQADLDAALEACKQINLNPGIHGFIAGHAWRNYTPQYTDEQRAVLDTYCAAQQAMKKLHEEYVLAGMRRAALEAKARGVTLVQFMVNDPKSEQLLPSNMRNCANYPKGLP